ncbi:MAG TPA: transcriptional regulator [Eggerthellaceae bacterium]|nr:transcriptional regulator [Eggerthellaceae bacterium]
MGRAAREARARNADELSDTRSAYGRNNAAYTPRTTRRRRTGVIVAVIVAILVVVGAGAAFAYFSGISDRLRSGVDEGLQNALVRTDMSNSPFYVLLLGTDKSADRDTSDELDGVYRSDSMILARIDPVNNKASLVSIPRDTLVDLGSNGYQKVNAAYAFGGPSLAVKAVSDLADVDISHYAEIDFDGFAAIVDSLGGIEVDVPVDIDDWEAGGALNAGLQTLNGEQALILCRTRSTYVDTSTAPDLMRAANQRVVLSAIAHKLLESDIATIAKTVNAVADYVTTDLALNDVIGIAQSMQGISTENDIYTASFPTDSAYIANGNAYVDAYSNEVIETVSPQIDEGYYLIPDEREWKKMKERMEQGLPPSEGTIVDEATGTVIATAGADAKDLSEKNCTISVKNGTGRDGLAASAATSLNGAGFRNVETGEAAAGYEYPETLVIYDDSAQKREADLIVDALGQGRAMRNDGSYLFDADFLVIIGDDWKADARS